MTETATFHDRLSARMASADSLLCVGLDPAPSKMPDRYQNDPASVARFCTEIIAATYQWACCYKPNLAFFTQLGPAGLEALWSVREAIPSETPMILDCKVGDVGETARAYARGWFDELDADAITVNPYMGEDSLEPFLSRDGKGVIVICKTSNPGSGDFQNIATPGEIPLYLSVAERCRQWDAVYPASVGVVVGATYPAELTAVRRCIGNQLILLPGIGAQGGDLAESLRVGLTNQGTGLICSASRAIMYASNGDDFAQAAANAARAMRDEINAHRYMATE